MKQRCGYDKDGNVTIFKHAHLKMATVQLHTSMKFHCYTTYSTNELTYQYLNPKITSIYNIFSLNLKHFLFQPHF